jgi:MFS family permease
VLFGAAVSIPAGMLVDRWGRRRLLVLLMQVAGGAAGCVAMATCMALAIDAAAPGRSGAALGLTVGPDVGRLRRHQAELVRGELEQPAQQPDVAGSGVADAALPAADHVGVHAQLGVARRGGHLVEPFGHVVEGPAA